MEYIREVQTEALDLNRPLRSTSFSGTKVVIISTKSPDPEYPLVGYFEGFSEVHTWSLGGRNKRDYCEHIENIPPVPKQWFAVTEEGTFDYGEYPLPEGYKDKAALLFKVDVESEEWELIHSKWGSPPTESIKQATSSGNLVGAFTQQFHTSPSRDSALGGELPSSGVGTTPTSQADSILDSLGDLG